MNKFISATLGLTFLISTASLASHTAVEESANVPSGKVGAAVRRNPSMDMQLARIADEAKLAGSPKKIKINPKKKLSWGNVLSVRIFENEIIHNQDKKCWNYAKRIVLGTGAMPVEKEVLKDQLLVIPQTKIDDLAAKSFMSLEEIAPKLSPSILERHARLVRYKQKHETRAAERIKARQEFLAEVEGDRDEYWDIIFRSCEQEARARVRFFEVDIKESKSVEYERYLVGMHYAKAAFGVLATQGALTEDINNLELIHPETLDPDMMEIYTAYLWNSMYFHMQTAREGNHYVHECVAGFFGSFTSMMQIMKDRVDRETDLSGCELMLITIGLVIEIKLRSFTINGHKMDDCSHCQVLLQQKATAFQTFMQLNKEIN